MFARKLWEDCLRSTTAETTKTHGASKLFPQLELGKVALPPKSLPSFVSSRKTFIVRTLVLHFHPVSTFQNAFCRRDCIISSKRILGKDYRV